MVRKVFSLLLLAGAVVLGGTGCVSTVGFPEIREFTPSQKDVFQREYSLSLTQLGRREVESQQAWENLYIQGSQVCDMLARDGVQSVRQQALASAKESSVFVNETQVLEDVDAFIRALTFTGSFCPGVAR